MTQGTSKQLATASEATPSPKAMGVFYEATSYHIKIPENADMFLSSNSDGTGDTFVDDEVTLEITSQDTSKTKATYTHDYSNGNQGYITPMSPVNLTDEKDSNFKELRGKTVTAKITFTDLYANSRGGSNFWLCMKE